VYISYLRRKIDKDHDEKLIHTVKGRGYMIGGPPSTTAPGSEHAGDGLHRKTG
jgi:DNA-binding winged helix-turn-helix (wHTH) protein